MPGDALRFDGRVALVTGAAAGLGRSIAELFAAHGADVAVCDRDAAGLDAVARAVSDHGRRAHTGELDVRDGDAVGDWVDAAATELGRLDVVVNNAGGTFKASFDETSLRGQAAIVDENFTSVTHVVRAALPHLRRSGGGAIVNVTSIEAHRACPTFGVYAAMKAAVENLTRTWALEYAAEGIRVNAVAPDAIPTAGELFLAEQTTDRAAGPRTPLGRVGTPDELAGPVLFLASDLASFVTGTTLHVDGGNDAARGWRQDTAGSWRP